MGPVAEPASSCKSPLVAEFLVFESKEVMVSFHQL